MIEAPEEVRQALAARHPDVKCVYSPQYNLFHLVVFWVGRWKHIRWIEQRHAMLPPDQHGTFLWPNVHNTVEWLNQVDTWGMAENTWQLKALQEHRLTLPSQRGTKIRKAKVSEMVKYGLAPELHWAMKKDKVI